MDLLTLIVPKDHTVESVLKELHVFNVSEACCYLYYQEDKLVLVIKKIFKEIDKDGGALERFIGEGSPLAYMSASKEWWQKNSDGLVCDWDSFCKIWEAAQQSKCTEVIL